MYLVHYMFDTYKSREWKFTARCVRAAIADRIAFREKLDTVFYLNRVQAKDAPPYMRMYSVSMQGLT